MLFYIYIYRGDDKMSKIKTKDLMNEYFSKMNEIRAKKNRNHIDRKEMYDYERKIGKQLIEMNAEELIEMVRTFGREKTDSNGTGVAYNSYKQISSMYRDLWDYYIDHYEVIRNPWYKKELRGREAYKKLSEGVEPLTWERVEETIQTLYDEYDNGYYVPMYVELIILLFYHGFATAKEIIAMKRGMVDFDNLIVNLPNKKIHISKRCAKLLEYFYHLDTTDAHTGIYYVVSWHDSYFRFFVRKSRVADFQDRKKEDVCATIVRAMTSQLRQKRRIDLNYRRIYNLGFYDFLCKRLGKQKANELVLSVRSPEDTEILYLLAKEYGISTPEQTTLWKGRLIQYVTE